MSKNNRRPILTEFEDAKEDAKMDGKAAAPANIDPVNIDPASAAKLGRVVAVRPDGTAVVDFPGNPCGPIPARVAAAVLRLDLVSAVLNGHEALLCFVEGDLRRPVLVDLLPPPGGTADKPAVRARVERDGQRLIVEAQDEIVLRCGEASVTLRQNGKILLRGVCVESHASETNRIKGAVVKVN